MRQMGEKDNRHLSFLLLFDLDQNHVDIDLNLPLVRIEVDLQRYLKRRYHFHFELCFKSAQWPSWRKPIVGTNPIVFCCFFVLCITCCSSLMVVMTFILFLHKDLLALLLSLYSYGQNQEIPLISLQLHIV